MSVEKIIAIIALALAVVGVEAKFTSSKFLLVGGFAVICIIAVVLFLLEKILKNSHGELANKFYYCIAKNRVDYIINYTESCYTYKSINEMEYTKRIDIISTKKNIDRCEEKFYWSSYNANMKIEAKIKEQEINMSAHQSGWTVFEIVFPKRLKKKEEINSGFKISGLVDTLGIAKPFLSLSVDNKIKERKMIVKVPMELRPENARFEITRGTPVGKIISSEEIEYNKKVGGYEVTVKYPRIGCTYSIIWEWAKT